MEENSIPGVAPAEWISIADAAAKYPVLPYGFFVRLVHSGRVRVWRPGDQKWYFDAEGLHQYLVSRIIPRQEALPEVTA